jgi:5'-methylthioadenosine phosphorylase
MVKKNQKLEPVKVAIIGGSGTYEIEGIKGLKEVKVKTPFGDPSDVIVVGELEGVMCAFLPRHGRGHRISPTELNSRANIYALKSLGAEHILSVSAVGSLKEEIKPRDFVLPDQIFDRTKARQCSFFGEGIVAHVGFAHPFCNNTRAIVHKGTEALGIKSHFGGTYVCIEGPQFSTKAESEVNRKHGFSIVGMTAIPEAKLAREAEICYTTIALVTDYDVWKEGEEVSIEAIMETLKDNTANVKKLIKKILPSLVSAPVSCTCREALKFAIMTKIDKSNKKTYEKLKLLIGKYM